MRFQDDKIYDNWDLSSDRANATRRVFETSGVSPDRIIRVSGLADTQALVPNNPQDPSNRRISVLLQYNSTEAVLKSKNLVKKASSSANTVDFAQTNDVEVATISPQLKNIQKQKANSSEKMFEDLRKVLR